MNSPREPLRIKNSDKHWPEGAQPTLILKEILREFHITAIMQIWFYPYPPLHGIYVKQ